MNTKTRFVLILALVLLAGAALVAMTRAAPGNAPLAQGGAPAVVAYQGEVRVDDAPYTDDGYFKFAVVSAAGSTTYWSNDGISTGGDEPTAAVQLTVNEGLFSVLLGDTILDGMEQPLTAGVFSEPDRYLRVWFSSDDITFDQLTPDTRIAAVPYALQAERVQGYAGVVVVAKSGGDYTGVQAAIDSISDAAADNAYLVWVAPGVYSETVTMKPYVHLQGAGQDATVITSTASSGAWPPTQATLVLASDASLRDLTVGNGGAGDTNAALLATAGMTRTLAADVTARAVGGGVTNIAIFLDGSGTGVTLQQVTALAENGSSLNSGLVNRNGAAAMLRGGAFTGRGGDYAWAIRNSDSGTTLEAENVSTLAENASIHNSGLNNHSGAVAVLRGGAFTGRGGNQANGVGNALSSTLTALGVTALAENGTENYAMGNYNVATMTLSGGVFTARGGENNYALSNELNVTMKADNVTALAENGSGNNHGLWNENNGTLVLHGASLTGRGGTHAYGIHNRASGTTLETESVTALGEDGIIVNAGLFNFNSTATVLNGGAFIGRGGLNAYGILNEESSAMLEANNITALGENGSTLSYGMENYNGSVAVLRGGAYTGRGGEGGASGVQNTLGSTLTAEGITALAENGSSENYGLYNNNTVTTTLLGGTFTGSGGTSAYGISNEITATLEAQNVTALGENGSSNYGLWNVNNATANVTQSVLEGATQSVNHDNTGSVTISNSRLAGAAVSGTVTCVAVSRGGTFNANGCP